MVSCHQNNFIYQVDLHNNSLRSKTVELGIELVNATTLLLTLLKYYCKLFMLVFMYWVVIFSNNPHAHLCIKQRYMAPIPVVRPIVCAK